MKEGEPNPQVDERRRCKELHSLSVLSCIGNKVKEGCNLGSKDGIFHCGQDGESSASL